MLKRILAGLLILGTLAACEDDARVASRNISKSADNFEVVRRIVFYNGITGDYMLSIEGRCSLENATTGPRTIAVTCKIGNGDYRKHFLGLSDNVTFFAEQMQGANVSVSHYRVTFKPAVILPDIDVRR
jgi:hypothetical protein